MGDWTRVRIVGSCEASQVDALNDALRYNPRTLEGFHCLCNGGMAGLPLWGAPTIDVCGNLGERGYGPEDVAAQLEVLAKAAPSLSVSVHFGAHYEGDACVATISLRDGKAAVGPPAVETIPHPDESQMVENLRAHMMAPR